MCLPSRLLSGSLAWSPRSFPGFSAPRPFERRSPCGCSNGNGNQKFAFARVRLPEVFSASGLLLEATVEEPFCLSFAAEVSNVRQAALGDKLDGNFYAKIV